MCAGGKKSVDFFNYVIGFPMDVQIYFFGDWGPYLTLTQNTSHRSKNKIFFFLRFG